MTFEELEQRIITWGISKGICSNQNRRNQLLKVFEEAGELADAELKNDMDGTVDAIGDVLVTVILYAKAKGIPVMTCLETAWDVIKDRTGQTVDGSFIKD